MSTLRRRLQLSVASWLVFQVMSLSALVPVDCCEAHRVAVEQKAPGCHESAAAASCPMRAADGRPCPMHQEAGGHASHRSAPSNECALRGTCKGPMAALFTLLSQQGILGHFQSLDPTIEVTAAATPVRASVVCRLEPPDSPPPRA